MDAGVGLSAYLRPARATRVVVLVAVRQNQEDRPRNRACLLAAEAEQTRRLELAEAISAVWSFSTSRTGRARRARWAASSSPPFELEVHTPQLLELGLQTEGFLLARLELHLEAAGFLLAPLE